MQASEYKNIFENEDSHFFYISTHSLVIELIKNYGSGKNLKILDAGCGTGLLAKKLSSFGEVWAIDSSPEALKYAKRRNLKNLKLASITKLPYQNNYFDVVTSIDVIYHQNVINDKKAIQELSRVLKPGGLLILKTPAFEWLKGSHDKVVKTKKRYTKSQIESLLKQNRLKKLKTSYFFLFLFPFLFSKRFLEKFGGKPRSEIGRLPATINSFLTLLISIEIGVLKFVSLPFGVSVIAIARKSIPKK